MQIERFKDIFIVNQSINNNTKDNLFFHLMEIYMTCRVMNKRSKFYFWQLTSSQIVDFLEPFSTYLAESNK